MKRLFAMLLCVCLVLVLLPAQALAEEKEVYYSNAALPDGTYPKVSEKGIKLVAPREEHEVDEPYTMVVKSCGRIFLMPTPYSGNGVLGVADDGSEVTILAEYGAMVFFRTDDGRYGWNGKIFFVEPDNTAE